MTIADAARGVLRVIRKETLFRTAVRIDRLAGDERARAVRNTLALVRVMDWLIGDRPVPRSPIDPDEPCDVPDACIEHGCEWPCAECDRIRS